MNTVTLADIVRELRRDAEIVEENHDEDTWSGIEAAGIYRDLADRIEAAAKAERFQIRQEAFDEAIDGEKQHCIVCKQVRGNDAAEIMMRLYNELGRALARRGARRAQ